MVNLSDIGPVFKASRIFGCGPHFVSDSETKLTRKGLIYSCFWSFSFACCCLYGLYLISREAENGTSNERKIMILTAVRTILAYVCFFGDVILTIKCNERLRTALISMRTFDAAVKYKLSKPTIKRLYCISWIIVGAIASFWLLVGWITYKCEMSSPLFNAITYVIVNAAISMQLIKFAGLLIMIGQRFKYLNKLLRSGVFSNVHQMSFDCRAINISSMHNRELHLQEVWWLHCTLSNAAETLNFIYSTQLLLWIATMWLNALSRIYVVSENLVKTDGLLLKLRESLLVSAYVASLFVIAATCHFTARKQNIEVGMYFNLRKIQFSAAGGFIRVDLPLLLSIAGAMTTYLVVLHNNS